MEVFDKKLDDIRIPGPQDRVYKDECFFSFDTPESPKGLLICMRNFLGFGEPYVKRYINKTGYKTFLRLRRTKKRKDKGPTAEKVSRLAIGEPGGFTPRGFEYEEHNSIVVFDGDIHEFSVDETELPLSVQISAKAIISADSALKKREIESNRWDGEVLQISKVATDLKQLDNGLVVSPSGWKCEKCDLTANLWMNITSGAIFCGRKNFDGSGGNNHAVEYYHETKYPLAVKLGTITKDGKADVYSYSEDNMVIDPKLKEHLAHFGLNPETLNKTDKSMVEIEIDMNQRIGEWATLTESGSKLIPCFGRGYTGLQSLGNTCYLNSVMQVLFSIPSVMKIYEDARESQFENIHFNSEFEENVDFQLCKLAYGLSCGDYSQKPSEDVNELDADESQPGIRPVAFKNVVGKGQFASNQQQDATEFFLHLMTLLERKSKLNFPGQCCQFEVEERIECGRTGHVKYLTSVQDYLPLPLPLKTAINKAEVDAYLERKKAAQGEFKEDIIRPRISFDSVLSAFLAEEIVSGDNSNFTKNTARIKTFPDHLLIQLKKFDVDPVTCTPYKPNVEVLMPDEIDLSCLKTKGGLQPGEMEWEESEPTKKAMVPDDSIVSLLTSMGFSQAGSQKAAIYTKNAGLEAAMNWVFEHSQDPDFNDPLNEGSQDNKEFQPSQENITMVMSMGFSSEQATRALKNTNGNVERAVDYIFSHPEEMQESGAVPKKNLTDGPAKYRLVAFISHMGTSHLVGHYVCHILKDEQWVIFNDNKVAVSEKPPKELAYMYLYQRI